MQSKFKNNANEQLYLLPLSVEEFIPENHLGRLINEIVEKLDNSSIESKYSCLGQKSYHPKSLIKLWVDAYATGIYSGRKASSQMRKRYCIHVSGKHA